VFDHDHGIPRAYTVPGIPHAIASTLGVQWALQQAKALDEPVSLYAPGKQNLRDVESGHPAVHALIRRGVPVRTWRDIGPGRAVVVALWPDEKHLLEADESSGTAALVAVTWSPRETLGWAQAKHAEPLGGPKPDPTPLRPLDPSLRKPSTGSASSSDSTRPPTSGTGRPWPRGSPSCGGRVRPRPGRPPYARDR
jgi:hypothetical protein